MSGYSAMNDNNAYWTSINDGSVPNQSYYEADYTQFQNQELEFKTMEEYGQQQQTYPAEYSQMYNPTDYDKGIDDLDEPPLLEELEIYPDRILEKVLAVMNPFHSHRLADDAEYLSKDPDLAGPIAFCLILAISLFISGNKTQFGYIYGISVVSCIMMYCLLTLMTAQSVFTFSNVASILGYCLIPIVGLSVLGVFVSLKGPMGIILAALAVLWSSLSASRLFVAISGDKQQQPLIAYPCALVSGVYVLLVIF